MLLIDERKTNWLLFIWRLIAVEQQSLRKFTHERWLVIWINVHSEERTFHFSIEYSLYMFTFRVFFCSFFSLLSGRGSGVFHSRLGRQFTSLRHWVHVSLATVTRVRFWLRAVIWLKSPWSYVRRVLSSLTLPNIAGFLRVLRFPPVVTLDPWGVALTGPLGRAA